MSETNFLRWAQRALNISLPENVRVDGLDTAEYRDRVRTFNDVFLFGKRPPGLTQVTAASRDAMIRCNHNNAAFRHWACIAMGDSKPLGPSAFRSAVRVWQSQQKLESDGWAGRITEERMRYFERTTHPGHVGPGHSPPPMPTQDPLGEGADDDFVALALNRLTPVKRIAAMAGRAENWFRSIGTFHRQARLCEIITHTPSYLLTPPKRWYFIMDDIRNIANSKDEIWRKYNEVLKTKGRDWINRRMEHTHFMTDGNYHLSNAVTGEWNTGKQLLQRDIMFRNAIQHISRTIEEGLWQKSYQIMLSGSYKKSDNTFYSVVPERIEELSRDPNNLYYAYYMPHGKLSDKIAKMEWPKQ